MKTVELRQKSFAELQKLLTELKGRLLNLQLLRAQNKLKKPHQLKQLRKDIARVLTVMNQSQKLKK